MILSVPHSGTRTLQKHLGYSAYKHFGLGAEAYTGPCDIPIRDPLSITVSWEARYPHDESKPQGELLRLLDLMLGFIKDRPKTVLWKIEDIEVHEGQGPAHWARDDPARALTLSRVVELRRWMDPARHDFYRQFYDLWWL